MKRSIPVAALLLILAACSQTRRASTEPSFTGGAVAPAVGRIDTIWAVNDAATGQRLGYMEETRYDNGAILYMVRGPDRRTGQGYIFPNNVAYRYVWIDGKRTDEHEKLGAATFASGARQILRYEKPVTLERMSDEEFLAEIRGQGASAAAAEPVGAGADAGGDDEGGGEFEE